MVRNGDIIFFIKRALSIYGDLELFTDGDLVFRDVDAYSYLNVYTTLFAYWLTDCG